ncbi:hypothetical protein A2U01_0084563, partial [Trifolium medium]|nr:hypothetical protein [Trifolium medium]
MHGNARMVVDDVWAIGKVIGVKFNGENANRFSALIRAGKGKQGQTEAAREERG